jgi:NAD(P)-dependent dehydrogenase (short-subunit alcohol dehydrogenase family)
MSPCNGKTALVTGASRGISRAAALALVKADAQVLVHYGRDATEAQAVVKQIRAAGGRAGRSAPTSRLPAARMSLLSRSVRSSATGSIYL